MPNVSETFAVRLREERERLGVSQAELARRISRWLGVEVYPTAITKVEKGERGVKIDEAVAIASALGVELLDLVSEEGAVAARQRELHRELERQENRAKAAMHEHQQATAAMIDIEQQLAQIDAMTSD